MGDGDASCEVLFQHITRTRHARDEGDDARDGDDDEGDDANTVRIAARGVVHHLAHLDKHRGTTKDDAVRVVRRLCAADTHACAIDEFTARVDEVLNAKVIDGGALADELLSATTSATTSASARALTKAIVRTVCWCYRMGMRYQASTHPVLRAVRAHRDAGAGALEATTSALANGGEECFHALEPFISRALLEYPAPVPRSAFAMLLHARLIGVAGGRGVCGVNARRALEACVRALGAYRAPTSEAREWIATAASDIIGAIEIRMFEHDEVDEMSEMLTQTTTAVVKQARAAALAGDNVLALVGALKRIGDLSEDSTGCEELVTLLPQVRTMDEMTAILALIAPHFPTHGASNALCATRSTSTLVLSKQSGAHLALSLSTPTLATTTTQNMGSHMLGNATFDGFVNDVLNEAWNDESSAALAACVQANASEKSPVVELACLGHPNAGVREIAAQTLRVKLSKRSSSGGASNVTVALLRLKTECERCSTEENAHATLTALKALAAGASNFIATPAILRAISSLMNTKPGEKAPNSRLHALALRLLSEMWMHNREIGTRLRAALEHAASSHDAAIVIGCAASVAAAAKSHPFRAAELVIPMQGCLSSKVPAARALALEAIDDMCASDALDFLPAFKVVTRHIPSIPEHPLVAWKWIKLLRHGGRDCEDFPDAAAKLVETLWNAATQCADARTRAEAWMSLSAYDAEFLIELGAPKASELAQAAFDERDALVSQGALQTLKVLAHHELASLSRTALATRETQQASHPPPADPLIYRVTQSMPKKMLANDACAAARLFLFRPPKTSSEMSNRSVEETKIKRTRAEAYRNEFRRAAKQIFWNGWWHSSLVTQSWSRFARRWFNAEVAARTAENGLDELHAEVRASISATAMEALKDTSTPDELQNIVLLLSAPVLKDENSMVLVDLISSILDEKATVIGAERGLLTALALAAGAVDDRGSAPRQLKVVEELIKRMIHCKIDGPSIMGSIALALGLLARGFAASWQHAQVSNCWRPDSVRRICSVLCAASRALGAPHAFAVEFNLPQSTESIQVPACDTLDALIGVHMGLAHAMCALNMFDERATHKLTIVVTSFANAASQGSLSAAIALPIAIKGLLKAKRTVESETLTLNVLSMVKGAASRDVRAIAGVILGVALDHGCAVEIGTSTAIIHELSSTVKSCEYPSTERARAILALSATLGGPWDGWDEHDVSSSGTSDESKVFSSPFLWGGDKGKIEAKSVLKTLESIVYASDDVASSALRQLTSWALAGVSDRTARIAVTTNSSAGDSKSNVPMDTVIGLMVQAVVGTVETSPSKKLIENAALALDVLSHLVRLPNASWSNALRRWWQISIAIDAADTRCAKDSLRRACLRMSRAHPGPSMGRNVLDSIALVSDDEFLAFAPETQLLVMYNAPLACSMQSGAGSSIIEHFVEIASRKDAAEGCMLSLWKGMTSVTEGEGASRAIRALTAHLPKSLDSNSTKMLESVAMHIKAFVSPVLRDECVRMLDTAIKPVICAHLFLKSQVPGETVTALSTWPKNTRVLTLKSTAATLRKASVTIRAQILHEASNLHDGDAIPCVAVLAAAWGPTAPLLPLTSIEQCIRNLPYTLSQLFKGELSSLSEAVIMSLLKHAQYAHTSIVRDAICEIRNGVALSTWMRISDAIA